HQLAIQHRPVRRGKVEHPVLAVDLLYPCLGARDGAVIERQVVAYQPANRESFALEDNVVNREIPSLDYESVSCHSRFSSTLRTGHESHEFHESFVIIRSIRVIRVLPSV